jgi:cell division protein FtsQ
VARDRRWAVALALVVFVALVVAALGAAATYSPLFDASRIRVQGSSRPDRQILDAAGLTVGMNVYHLDTGAAERALLSDPWIRTVHVRRELPSTIIVEVEERVPVVVADGVAAAADGTALPGRAPHDLPPVRAAVGTLEAGQVVWAAAAAGALDPATRARVEAIVVTLDGSLMLTLDDGPLVRWGATGDDAAKAVALRALLRQHDGGRPMVTVDVSVPSAPSARFA